MSKRDDLKIDIMSSIDEDIIEKHTQKRYDLLNGNRQAKGRKTLVAFIAFAACLALLASVFFALLPVIIPSGQAPVYQGMTVSNESPLIAPKDDGNTARVPTGSSISFLGKHDGKDEEKPNRPVDDIVKDSLTVETDSEYLYYSKPNEDIYITVHINNPEDFEILSFTLNGVKYSSYMFEEGSDLENLVLKVNVGDAEGVVEYTIDAIKYIDGTVTKNVIMEGDKTVSVAITPDAPTVDISEASVGITDISFSVSLNDEKNLVAADGEDYFAVLCDGDSILHKQIITSKDKTTIGFSGLDPETTYRYAIIGVFDAVDGAGKCIHVLCEEEFTTQALVSIGDSYIDGIDVCYDVVWNESYNGDCSLDTLELYDGEAKLRDLDVAAERISGLPFDREYTLVATYTYNGKQYKTYKTVYSPKSSEGLEMSYGVVVGSGSCSDSVLYINAPIEAKAFSGNTHIREVYLGSGVETVGMAAFEYCSNLTSLTISDGIKSFGIYAFGGCVSLESVYIEDIAGWCEIVFGGWESDGFGTGCPEANPMYYAKKLFVQNELITDLVIPDGVTKIGNCAFADYPEIKSITIPDSVTSIGDMAFYYCKNLTSITIPNSVTSIGDMAFCYCESLTSITIPNSVTSIGDEAFMGCSGLTSISIPNSVTSIGDMAFCYCESLTSITIPNSVTSIGDEAFMGCSGLTSISIPNSVTSIGDATFADCVNLESITIPNSVKRIGAWAFVGCRNLKSITIPKSVTRIDDNAFKDCGSLTTIYYAGTKEEWESIRIHSDNYELLNAVVIGSDGPIISK